MYLLNLRDKVVDTVINLTKPIPNLGICGRARRGVTRDVSVGQGAKHGRDTIGKKR